MAPIFCRNARETPRNLGKVFHCVFGSQVLQATTHSSQFGGRLSKVAVLCKDKQRAHLFPKFPHKAGVVDTKIDCDVAAIDADSLLKREISIIQM